MSICFPKTSVFSTLVVIIFGVSNFRSAMSLTHLSAGSTEPPSVEGKLRLYSMRFCPYAQRVHLVLNAKKVQYDVVFINLTQKPEWYLKKFTLGKVPAIKFEGTDLYESLILAEFLNEQFSNPPLHSSSPLQKAKDRLLVENFAKVGPHFYKLVMGETFDASAVKGVSAVLNEYANELKVRGTAFFSGSKPGMPDYMIWPWFERLGVLKLLHGDKVEELEKLDPVLAQWISSMKEDPSVKSYLLTPEQHFLHIQKRRAGDPNAYDVL